MILAVVLWLVMTKIPSHCGVLLKTKPGNCPNDIEGLFFGCGQARHHLWLRPLGFIGLGRKPRPRPVRAGQPSAADAGPASPALEEAVEESGRNRAIFYATLISTCAGLTSASVDLIGAFSKSS
ncbi:hypothetical protein [Actinoplanes solisilvae]|uniref:hypothetical protein n=1 Tax=Actinoplanes solisilvae TaxID=2486853 RepID=UPI000FDBE476|nr:hypothetical protein [Actinoplanes solisilvae]